MILELDRLAIGTDPGAPLPPVSAVAAPGHPGVVAIETEQAPTVASLVAGGRMSADSGRLLVDGHEDPDRARRAVALVDTPGVAEPFPVMSLRRIAAEELAFAGHRASRDAVDTVLDHLGLTALADTHVEHVSTADRIRLLVELALLRDGVEALVVTSPERHGGSVREWFGVLREVASRGIAVLVVCSKAAAETIETMLESAADTGPSDDSAADAAPTDVLADADSGSASTTPPLNDPSSQESTRS